MPDTTIFDRRTDDEDVTCIACAETLPRSDAREYDKHGDRYSREGKEFEFLCKPCYRDCCHQPRDGLEERLVEAGASATDRESFITQYHELVTDDTPRTRR